MGNPESHVLVTQLQGNAIRKACLVGGEDNNRPGISEMLRSQRTFQSNGPSCNDPFSDPLPEMAILTNGHECLVKHLRVAVFFLVGVSDIFYFFLFGGGEGGVRGAGRTISFENPRRGGLLAGGRGGGEGPGGCLREIWGGGSKYFFSGPKFPPSFFASSELSVPKTLRS